MATAADLDAKNTELQAQDSIVRDLLNEVSALAGPYHAKLDELGAAIEKLKQIDAENEQLTKDYTAPEAPPA